MRVLLLLFISFFSCSRKDDGYKKLFLIEVDEFKGGVVITDKPISDKPLVCAILSYYGVEFMYSKGDVFVREKSLNSDKEFYWNVLLKANDSIWVKEHLVSKTAVRVGKSSSE